MSRGKYRRRRGRRDQLAHTAAVAQLQAHIAAEQDRLQLARRSAAHTAATRARLDHEVELAHRRIVAAETEAAEVTRRIGAPWQNLRAATAELRRVDEHLTPRPRGRERRADHVGSDGPATQVVRRRLGAETPGGRSWFPVYACRHTARPTDRACPVAEPRAPTS
jgi:predicted  nucleic acid-binding Zn-ribbon protein